jgi:tetratricopeptide (TPR) repeat protein
MSTASLQDSRLSTVNFLLSNRSLDELIADRNRVLKAIDLAINARLNLDPYFDPKELSDANRDFLADRIIGKIVSKESNKDVKPVYNIHIPKNSFQSRIAEYFSLEEYSIRYLLALVLSEKFDFLDSVYGGKLEIFQIDNGDSYRLKRRRFQKLQNSLLSGESFSWLVYVDISNFYSSIKKSNLIEIIKTKLSLSDENYFLKLVEMYFGNISIGSWCDNFIQNIYLSNLDLAMNSSEWNYMRMNDDIRVYCNSLQDAEMAFNKIEAELKKLDLEINKAKQFIIEPMINKTVAKWGFDETRCYDYTNGKISPIIELSKVSEYDIENIYMLTRDSDANECVQIKYNFRFQKKLNYRDEIFNKLGFEVDGIDIREILENFENRETLSCLELKLLCDVIFYTSTSYQFTFRLVRLLVSRSFSILHEEGVVSIVESVFKKLSWVSPSPNFANYSSGPTYLDYVLLRVVFIEGLIFACDSKVAKKAIVDWFERLIYCAGQGYFLNLIKIIIETRAFRFIDEYYTELLFDEEYWLKIIYREFERRVISHGAILENEKEGIYELSHHFLYYKDKLSSIEAIRSKFLTSYRINVFRANYYYLIGDYSNAGLALQMCNLKTLKTDDLLLLASSCSKLGDVENAKLFYTKLLSIEGNATAYYNRGLIFIKENRVDEAILDFSDALKLLESSRYYEDRAYCFIRTGQLTEAMNDIDRAIEIDSQRISEVNYVHKRIFSDFDFLPEFFANYIKIPKMDSLSEFAYLKRAVINKSLGNIAQAYLDVEIYCKLHKNNYPSVITRLTNELLEDKLKFWRF